MSRKLGYQLYSVRHPDEEDTRMFPPGLFGWVAAFEKYGKFGRMNANISRENLEESDIIHVNYTPTNCSYISALREALGENSSTKIIANVDFGTMMWNMIDPLVMKDQLSKADIIFHVESNGAERLKRLLPDKKIHVLPHPTNVEDLKIGVKRERSPVITCQYHRYSDTWCEYYYGLLDIRKEFDINIVLMNYTAPKTGPKVPIICMFTELVSAMPYPDYVGILSQALINVDITHDYTYGRGVVDAAALKVPTVGSGTIEAQRMIWPELSLTPGIDRQMGDIVERLLDDDDWREELAQRGSERCETYSQKNSYENMVKIVEECDK